MIQETDRNLMDAYCRGEDGAFETLVRRHGAAVLGYLVKMTQNKDHAEDLFQETFQKVHESAEKFTGDNLRPWALKIATNAAIGRWRKEKKHAAVSLAAPAGCPDGEHCPTLESTLKAGTPEPNEQAELNEKRQQVRAALETLPTQQRAALILNYYHQMTYKQIAESLDCSVGSVRTHLFRALKKMAAVLPNPAGGVE
ncbi:MAG: RNA polymerase sigma factor [Planctomycetota bacterium]|jgi:RNA polymerase sigma-70 factor (ECF subfamily)